MISQSGLTFSKSASPENSAPLELEWEASEDSPLINPAIIIKNWGNQLATLSINGKEIPDGTDFRQGIRKGPEGEDLIIWIRMDREKPVNIVLEQRIADDECAWFKDRSTLLDK